MINYMNFQKDMIQTKKTCATCLFLLCAMDYVEKYKAEGFIFFLSFIIALFFIIMVVNLTTFFYNLGCQFDNLFL